MVSLSVSDSHRNPSIMNQNRVFNHTGKWKAPKNRNIPPLMGGARPIVRNRSIISFLCGLCMLFVIGGIYVLFQRGISIQNSESSSPSRDIVSETSLSSPENILSNYDERDVGSDNNLPAQDSSEENFEDTNVVPSSTQTTTQLLWTAKDHVSQDINSPSYTVVYGDTLWEIAEGRYGTGFEWEKILFANQNAIGFLPNGSQALIIPGQVLTLP